MPISLGGGIVIAEETCPKCNGKGEIIADEGKCQVCDGQKVIDKEGKLNICIEPGIPERHVYIFPD